MLPLVRLWVQVLKKGGRILISEKDVWRGGYKAMPGSRSVPRLMLFLLQSGRKPEGR